VSECLKAEGVTREPDRPSSISKRKKRSEYRRGNEEEHDTEGNNNDEEHHDEYAKGGLGYRATKKDSRANAPARLSDFITSKPIASPACDPLVGAGPAPLDVPLGFAAAAALPAHDGY